MKVEFNNLTLIERVLVENNVKKYLIKVNSCITNQSEIKFYFKYLPY